MTAATEHDEPASEPRAGQHRGGRRPRRKGGSPLCRVRDALLASRGRGKAYALTLVDALQRARKHGPLRVTGSWRELYDAVGLTPRCDKTARYALAMLAEIHPMVTRVSGHVWSLDTTATDSESGHRTPTRTDTENEHASIEGDTEAGHAPTPKVDIENGHGPEPSGTWAEHGNSSNPKRNAPMAGVRSFTRARARVDLDRALPRAQPWMHNPLARAFSEQIDACGVLSRGRLFGITLTVAEGVDIEAVAQAFADRFAGVCSGAWLVPETSPAGRRHVHGLVVSLGPRAITATWQRCGGGIPDAQCVDPIAADDTAHRHRTIAYALKRRDHEPGEVAAAGLLAMPWVFALEGAPANGDTATRLRKALEDLPRVIPSHLPPAPELGDEGWFAEIERWPSWLRDEHAQQTEGYRRHGTYDERQRSHFAYLALRSLAYP